VIAVVEIEEIEAAVEIAEVAVATEVVAIEAAAETVAEIVRAVAVAEMAVVDVQASTEMAVHAEATAVAMATAPSAAR
jgi:hypothetical protein